MDATSTWPAVVALRARTATGLALGPGDRLLDVGCGPGDAAAALAAEAGSVVGVDLSAAMVATLRSRAAVSGVVADALALPVATGSFAAVRAERTLQWVADPGAAVAEMVRALRPGGRLALIDSDWSTFRIDVGDASVAALVRTAVAEERRRPAHVGGRLASLAEAAGLAVVDEATATHEWTAWRPDAEPAPAGCFSMRSLADDLVGMGALDAPGADRFVATIEAAARAGRFAMALTMGAVVAVSPSRG